MSELWIGIWVGFAVATIASSLGIVCARRSNRKARPTHELIDFYRDELDGLGDHGKGC